MCWNLKHLTSLSPYMPMFMSYSYPNMLNFISINVDCVAAEHSSQIYIFCGSKRNKFWSGNADLLIRLTETPSTGWIYRSINYDMHEREFFVISQKYIYMKKKYFYSDDRLIANLYGNNFISSLINHFIKYRDIF